jgi:hypothetical protein
VLIIDSISHAWQELLEEVDKIAETKYKGNSWSAWSKATPIQRKFIDHIVDFNGHVIVTMRSKTEWTIDKNENGKSTPKRIGLAPEQGKGIEYEFDLLLELSNDHSCHVVKDRTGMYQDTVIEKLSEDFGKDLKDWLNNGESILGYKELSDMLEKCLNEDELNLFVDANKLSLQKLSDENKSLIKSSIKALKGNFSSFIDDDSKKNHLLICERIKTEIDICDTLQQLEDLKNVITRDLGETVTEEIKTLYNEKYNSFKQEEE